MSKRVLNQLLSSTGDGDGTSNAIGDHQLGLSLQLSNNTTNQGTTAFIQRLIVNIEDASGFAIEVYGGLAGALVRGVDVCIRNPGAVLLQTVASYMIFTNGDWSGQANSSTFYDYGAGNEVLQVVWDFPEPIQISLGAGQYFEVGLEDDFTGLINHRYTVQGFINE